MLRFSLLLPQLASAVLCLLLCGAASSSLPSVVAISTAGRLIYSYYNSTTGGYQIASYDMNGQFQTFHTSPPNGKNGQRLARTQLVRKQWNRPYFVPNDLIFTVCVCTPPFLDMNPSVSIDQRYAVFYSDRSGNQQIWRVDLTTSNVACMTCSIPDVGTSSCYDPKYSHDGSKIVFKSTVHDGLGDVYLMDSSASASSIVNLTPSLSSTEEWAPNFAADDSQIFFTSRMTANDPMSDELFVVSVTGTGLMRLTTNSVPDWYPVADPNAARVVFISKTTASGHDAFFSMALDGSNRQVFLSDSLDLGDPSFSTAAGDTRLTYLKLADTPHQYQPWIMLNTATSQTQIGASLVGQTLGPTFYFPPSSSSSSTGGASSPASSSAAPSSSPSSTASSTAALPSSSSAALSSTAAVASSTAVHISSSSSSASATSSSSTSSVASSTGVAHSSSSLPSSTAISSSASVSSSTASARSSTASQSASSTSSVASSSTAGTSSTAAGISSSTASSASSSSSTASSSVESSSSSSLSSSSSSSTGSDNNPSSSSSTGSSDAPTSSSTGSAVVPVVDTPSIIQVSFNFTMTTLPGGSSTSFSAQLVFSITHVFAAQGQGDVTARFTVQDVRAGSNSSILVTLQVTAASDSTQQLSASLAKTFIELVNAPTLSTSMASDPILGQVNAGSAQLQASVPTGDDDSGSKGIILGLSLLLVIIIGGGALLVIAIAIACCCYCRNRKSYEGHIGRMAGTGTGPSSGSAYAVSSSGNNEYNPFDNHRTPRQSTELSPWDR